MYKLLIADDESKERELLTDLVISHFPNEFHIETADNGRHALEKALLLPADLILMDIEMPGISGLEAARQILEKCPSCKIIFVTAYGLFQYAYEAMRLGACGYILKPVICQDAVQNIQKALTQMESERRLLQLASAAPPAAKSEGSPAPMNHMALLMQQVQSYIHDNYMYELSLDSVSEIMKISPAYLSAQFKKYVHTGFLDYLTDVRMQAACELLSDPLRSTAEVAGMVGYEDASYFARAFKKRIGQTPTEYRRMRARSMKEGRS